MITQRRLVDALVARKVAAWVVVERDQELARVDAAGPRTRTESRTRWTITVHHDVPSGRGTARLEAGVHDEPEDLVDQAIRLAAAAVVPAWRSIPPAAPASVELSDDRVAKAHLLQLGRELLEALPTPAGATVVPTIELLREQVRVEAHSGFEAAWPATELRTAALVSLGARSLELVRDVRRTLDLDLGAAIVAAVGDLALLASTTPTVPGRAAVMLGPEALLHGAGVGLWSVFADHADAEIERQRLSRYRLRAPIASGAELLREPLSILSDGALAFGLWSAPVSDEGAAVRRFPLIERGTAVGLGLTMREAARRGLEPNGGVRNLVVGPGTWDGAPPPGRSLEVRRLRSVSLDPFTGDASLELGLAIERDGTTERPVEGGTIRLDLVAALARARRSATMLTRGAYRGPAAVLLDDVELLA